MDRRQTGLTTTPGYIISLLFCLSITGCSPEPPDSTVEIAKQGLYSATLSSTDSIALIASLNHGASLWNTEQGERLYSWNHSKEGYTSIANTAISGNGKVALTADQRRFVLWNTKNGQSVGFWNADEDITSVALSPKGNFVLLGLKNYTTLFLDTKQNRVIHTLPQQGTIRSVALSVALRGGQSKKKYFIGLTSSNDMTAKLWDLSRGKLLHGWSFSNVVNHVDISPNGQWYFIANQHESWSLHATNAPFQAPPYLIDKNRSMSITATSFSKNGKWLLIGGSTRIIELWDIKSKKRIQHWSSPKKNIWSPYGGGIMAVGFNPNQTKVYAITSIGQLFSWKIALNSPPNEN